jgi:hypothetical protein
VWRKQSATALLVATGLFCSSPAWAHDAFGNGKSVWTGALHLLTSPLAVAAMVGLVLALFGVQERMSLVAAVCAAATSALAAAVPAQIPAFAVPAVVVVLGLSAAAGLKPSKPVAVLLSLLAGLAAGAASDLDNPSWQGVIGIAGVMLFVTISALAALEDLARVAWLKNILPIARRILGSWVSAIGLLLGALAIRSGGGF